LPARLARSFSWQCSLDQSPSSEDLGSHHLTELPRRICLPEPPTGLDHHFRSVAGPAPCVTPSLKRRTGSTGLLNLFSITYAFRPRLRIRLTLGGRTFPRKSWDYGGRDSHPAYRYSCPHNHFYPVHARLPLRFDQNRTLPYHSSNPEGPEKSAASAAGLVPIIFGTGPLD
jgi:hypothetical protein